MKKIGDFWNWTVYKQKDGYFLCECQCGTSEVRRAASSIKNGGSKSCGCLRSQNLRNNNPMHNEETKRKVGEKVKKAHTKEMIDKRTAAAQSDEAREKRITTNKAKYGGVSPLSSEEVREKVKATKLDRYGKENYVNPDKAKETNLTKYGVDNVMRVPEISSKMTNTLRSKKKAKSPANDDKLS